MKPFLNRLRWIGGALLPWFTLWLLLGLRVFSSVKAAPHPMLKGMKLTGVMVEAAREWAFKALAAYLVFGLVFGLLAKLATSNAKGHNMGKHMSFKAGLIAGLGTGIFFHAVLYCMVPMGMVGLPLLNRLPVGLVLLALLGMGAALLWIMLCREAEDHRLVRLGALLLCLSLFPSLPHDLFRRQASELPALPRETPRVLILGIDGVRQDTLEALMPQWKAPEGLHPICVAPATRRSWSYLFGKDPEELKSSIVMPFRSDLSHPESFELLADANKRGYKVAWAIDDSLTASFGYQLGFFDTAKEAPGGWKYWFSLGLGNTWPVWTWAENYTAEIETTNAWSDVKYFWRDVGRLLKSHHLVFAHSCYAHEPIRLKFGELQALYGWRWLKDGIYHYRPCFSPEEVGQDDGYRADLRSSALDHYKERIRFGVQRLSPHLEEWATAYPGLSGVFTSDHGETHLPVLGPDGKIVTYLEGIHGFTLEPLTMWVPYHPFGQTHTSYRSGDLLTWIEIRDGLRAWLRQPGPLQLRGRSTPMFFQFPTIRAIQQETQDEGEVAKDRGLDPRDLAGIVYLRANGVWYAPDEARQRFGSSRLSLGWAQGDRLTLFNPSGRGTYHLGEFQGYNLLSESQLKDEEVAARIAPFVTHSPRPYGWVDPMRQETDALRH